MIFDQGYEVEEYTKQLFPGFIDIEAESKDFKEKLKISDELIKKNIKVIYQPTFAINGFNCRCDFLVFDTKNKKYNIYEVKSSTSINNDHLNDVAFQNIVLEKSGIEISKKYLVHINNEYFRYKKINVKELFKIEDITENVDNILNEVEEEMKKCKKYLNQKEEPKNGCDCIYLSKGNHCETIHLSHQEITDYNIHELTRITSKKLKELIKSGITKIEDIEEINTFTKAQQNQIITYQKNKEVINKKGIREILNSYNYPLYFFDYETYAPAIPIFDGYRPYQRIPIQFSLHYIEKKGGELKHFDYVHNEKTDPSETIVKLLIKNIDPKGTILAWNMGFEKSVTKELRERLSEYKKSLNRIINQIEDLMDIFKDQYYVHKDLKGRYGIEPVMQVLASHINYDELPITGADVGPV